MAVVVFYEKPGCVTNARQKALLRANGCELRVRDLLSEPWTGDRLRAFFEKQPVSHWFNPAAPRVRSGEIDPSAQDPDTALALLLEDPLLIRRPLLDTGFGKTAGFDDAGILEALGVYDQVAEADNACAFDTVQPECPLPETSS